MSDKASAVLVDTSVWIELLRNSSHPSRGLLETLIADDRARLCTAIAAELIQGASTAQDLHAAEELAQTIPGLKAEELTWLDAGRMSQRLRIKGITVGLLDCYLAQIALDHGCALLSLDKHFPMIAKHTSLQLLA